MSVYCKKYVCVGVGQLERGDVVATFKPAEADGVGSVVVHSDGHLESPATGPDLPQLGQVYVLTITPAEGQS